MKKEIKIISHLVNANQNYSKVSLHTKRATIKKSDDKNVGKDRNWKPHASLVGM